MDKAILAERNGIVSARDNEATELKIQIDKDPEDAKEKSTISNNKVSNDQVQIDSKVPNGNMVCEENKENLDSMDLQNGKEKDANIPGEGGRTREDSKTKDYQSTKTIERENSNSSLSSTNSNSSTRELIKSLSTSKIKPEENSESKIRTHTIDVPKNSERKPVKFTVRKVSHEPVHFRDSKVEPKKEPVTTSNELEKAQGTLHTTQRKYDQCVLRISKIEREIDFLTRLLPPYNVDIDFATRSKILRAIDKLEMKKDEMEKMKYSLGVTITRLWREDELSEIWVRGVGN